jgi:hypothetical protein
MGTDNPVPQSDVGHYDAGGAKVAVGLDEPQPNNEPWYSARCVFRDLEPGTATKRQLYEERIVLIKAASFAEAMHLAEVEARDYASAVDMEFVDFVEVFHLFERKLRDGTEVFSLIRESDLPPQAYVEQFFDTGFEYRGTGDHA